MANIVPGLSVAPAAAPAVSVGNAEIASLTGTYYNPTTASVRWLTLKDENLMIEGNDFGGSFALVPLGSGRSRVGTEPMELLL